MKQDYYTESSYSYLHMKSANRLLLSVFKILFRYSQSSNTRICFFSHAYPALHFPHTVSFTPLQRIATSLLVQTPQPIHFAPVAEKWFESHVIHPSPSRGRPFLQGCFMWRKTRKISSFVQQHCQKSNDLY